MANFKIEPEFMAPIPLRMVAKAGLADDWAMYMGPEDWEDLRICREGTKVGQAHARTLIAVGGNINPGLLGFDDLVWRP